MSSSLLKRSLTAILSSLVLVSTSAAAHAEPAAVPQDASASVTGFIDSPSDGSVLAAGQPFTVNGWLVDRTVISNVSVDAVSVSAQQAGQPAIDLGQAQLALDRPDVAAATNNPNWANAGYS